VKNKKALIVRKLVHAITGLLILILTYIIERDVLLFLIIGGLIFSFATFRNKKLQLVHKTADGSLGSLFYPLGILSSFLLLADLPLSYFRITLLVLTVSDSLANLIGQFKNRNIIFIVWKDKKSIYGLAAYTFSNVAIFYTFLPHERSNDVFLVFSLLLAAIAFEVISSRGSDNLSIPLGLSLFFIFQDTAHPDFLFLSVVLIVLTAGAYSLFKWKMLTRYGSLAAWLLGVYFLVLAGWNWMLPVLFFFFSSLIFTKISQGNRRIKVQSGGRNAWQVLANVLWALISSILYLLTKNELFIYFFIAFVAAVTADTWASEIGPVFNKMSFSVADWKMYKSGITGGISVSGTLAALAGSFIVSALSYFLFFEKWNWTIIAMLSVSAFLACFADTFIGAFFEEKLSKLPFFKHRDNPESIAPNDIVNLSGSFMAFVFFLVFYFAFLS
jgi:uncharacterized protein (TIGR00297 family)